MMWSMIVIFIDATYTAFLVPVTAGMNISEFDVSRLGISAGCPSLGMSCHGVAPPTAPLCTQGWGAVVNAIGGAFYAADLVISFNVVSWKGDWRKAHRAGPGCLAWQQLECDPVPRSQGFVVVYKMRRALVMSRGKIARFYVLHHRFWVDLVSVVPWTIQMAVLGGASIGDMGVEGFNILRLVRLIRLGA